MVLQKRAVESWVFAIPGKTCCRFKGRNPTRVAWGTGIVLGCGYVTRINENQLCDDMPKKVGKSFLPPNKKKPKKSLAVPEITFTM